MRLDAISSLEPHSISYGGVSMNRWIERLSNQDEALPGQTLVELLGDRRVLIEHHKGVTEYRRDRIQIRVKYGTICLCGSDLHLCRMTGNQLVIVGRIDAITLLRGD